MSSIAKDFCDVCPMVEELEDVAGGGGGGGGGGAGCLEGLLGGGGGRAGAASSSDPANRMIGVPRVSKISRRSAGSTPCTNKVVIAGDFHPN